jgi:hypothetical protein
MERFKLIIMKNLKQINLILFVLPFLMHSQTYPLYNTPENEYFVDGAYYKDINDDLNKYEGLWRVEINSSTSFEILFNKVFYDNLSMKRKYDTLIGEVKYVENDITIYNTMSNIINIYESHALMANGIFDNVFGLFQFSCEHCQNNEKYITGGYKDPARPYLPGTISMKYFIENGVEKIKIKLLVVGSIMDGFPHDDFRIPSGEYILIKQ